MKIIAGIHRGRTLLSISDDELRPSTGKLKEAIFSILTSGQFTRETGSILDGATVMDLCCGTGVLGLESLSRGAKHAVLIDKNAKILQIAGQNARSLGEAANVSLIRTDANLLPKARITCDVVFFDPPYGSKIITEVLAGLIERGWLIHGSIIVIEMAKKEELVLNTEFETVLERVYGKTKLVIVKMVGEV
jgi:16S rRNA (guanine966-N2)-methyltransferase